MEKIKDDEKQHVVSGCVSETPLASSIATTVFEPVNFGCYIYIISFMCRFYIDRCYMQVMNAE